MKKLSYLLILLFSVAAFGQKVYAQSPADGEINKLNFNLKMLKSMESREDWTNKAWVERYEKYVNKAESSLKAVQAKDPAYDIAEVSSDVTSRRTKLDEALAKLNASNQATADAKRAEAEAQRAEAMAKWKEAQAEKERENKAAAESGKQATSKGGPVYGERPEGTIMVWVRNQCTTRMQYCLDDGSSQTFIQIGPNEWSMKYVKPGTKIAQVTNNRCGTVVGTATKHEQEINLCK